VDSEVLVNPASRKQVLWVTAETKKGSLGMTTFLKYPSYQIHKSAPPVGPSWNAQLSRGEFEVDQVKVTHQNGKIDLIQLLPQDWSQIDVEPQESVVLDWIAHPRAYAPACSVPSTTAQTANWLIPGPVTFKWFPYPHISESMWTQMWSARSPFAGSPPTRTKVSIPGTPLLRQQVLSIQWSIDGVQLTGAWNRKIRITHPFVLKGDATRDHSLPSNSNQPIEYHEIANGTSQVNLSVGNLHPAAQKAACQGIYP
jgi:hypothetical protein